MEDIKKIKIINGVCTAVSITTSITTPLLYARGREQAKTYILEYLDYYQLDSLETIEKIKLCWKYYIPAAISMSLGVGAGITAGVYSNKTSSAIVSKTVDTAMTIATSSEGRSLLADKIREKYGPEVEQSVKDMMADTKNELREKYNPLQIEDLTPSDTKGVQICDDTHGRYFKGSIEEVKAAVNEINALITKGQEMTLSDIYDFLALPSGTIDRSLKPVDGELFELDWASSIYNGQPCAHFGFKRLVVDEQYY